ncbi:MAG: ATP-binding protein [Roseiflexaceae bacterium]
MTKLYNLALFEDLTDEELEWVTANSSVQHLETGDYFVREGDRATGFYVVLEGELQITRTIDGKTKVMGTTPVGVIGNELPLLYGTPAPATSRAIMPCRLLVFDLRAFRQLFTYCPTVGAKVLRVAAERTQNLAGMAKQQEKMAALGKLSAGLAHELNNPASAARRAAGTLRQALPTLQQRTVRLCGLGLDTPQFDTLLAFQREAAARPEPHLGPLERSDREDELGQWLDEQGVTDAWDLAPGFVGAGIDTAELAGLVEGMPPGSLGDVLAWLQQALAASALLSEIEHSSERIAELVAAVKSYTYMDQAPLQEVNLHDGLDTTLKVMRHKLKSIEVVRQYDPELPRIMARGGELNQVWTNLIDNAADAMGGKGTIWLITRCENSFAMVEIADNGPGIPKEVMGRIFEPFFTTKGVGAGTGLGLDITYRVIQQHNGTIEVQSQPGKTRFIVRLPVGKAEL